MKSRALLVLIGFLGISACGSDQVQDRMPAADSKWNVVATSVGDRKILAIKAIREATGLGLKEAKDLADAMPSVVIAGVPRTEAEAAAKKLRDAGMTVQIQPK